MPTDYEVRALFAEPYFRTNIASRISEEQVHFLKSLKMTQNQTNLISDDLYIFEKPEMRSIAEAVQEALDVFAREVMGISQQLYVTQSWALMNPPGAGMHGHTHSNSVISGSLYFADLAENSGGMIFNRHNGYQQLMFYPEQGRVNLYNTSKNKVQPKRGDLILFSSSLLHFVEPNFSSQPRRSIAFNTFVKGKIGDLRDVSELAIGPLPR